ncbi:hypothetical protein IMZ31_19510 (plasmid) [Pontibacillus sp. ALD_SL1]|uniref:hypothetical protein n=1 Tax=Pontibacillus sp. ALD_SL1 TaxID=2777185 RepID=UPI001A9656C4|nr:hypothetical protein [Pontibacillus sp. ALD_SL1]QST02739.1 hypothetical protein IMZ31_19510 [Pontibacillus sp. ALD_SL1]
MRLKIHVLIGILVLHMGVVYGCAFVGHLLFETYLFEGGLSDTRYAVIGGLSALPFLYYVLSKEPNIGGAILGTLLYAGVMIPCLIALVHKFPEPAENLYQALFIMVPLFSVLMTTVTHHGSKKTS